mmetsp:Transcript_23757/g.65904  ORF Transcript_23757/g.65904 Transcript_23757/m.65904 type:complete len:479 (-) Transcript_23757:170-1606(-)
MLCSQTAAFEFVRFDAKSFSLHCTVSFSFRGMHQGRWSVPALCTFLLRRLATKQAPVAIHSFLHSLLLPRKSHLVQQKGKIKGQLPQVLVPVRRRKVPGGHVDLEAAGIPRGRLVPELGRKLGRFPVLDPRIVEATRQQTGRIASSLPHVVDGGVLHHVVVVFFLVGISPFLPLHDRQRDGGIDHGRDDVDKGHPQERRPKQLGGLVQRRSDQQSPGGPSLAAELLRGGDLALRRRRTGQPPSNVDEIEKGVFLAEVLGALGFLVPLPAHLATAPDVGNGVDHAPVEECQARGTKGGLDAGVVGSVSVQVGRKRRPLLFGGFHHVGPIDNADGNVRFPVPGADGDPLAGIQRLVVPGDLLFLEDGSGAQIGRIVQGNANVAEGRHEGIVGDHHRVGGVVQIGSQPHVVGVFLEGQPEKVGDGFRFLALKRQEPDLGESPLPAGGHRVGPKGGDPGNGSVVSPVKEQFAARRVIVTIEG